MSPDGTAVAFTVLGRRFAARGVPTRLAEWLRAGWDFPEQSAPPQTFTIDLDVVASAPLGARDGWTRLEVVVPGRTIRFRSDGRRWETGDEAAGLSLELRDDGAAIAVWGSERQADPVVWHHSLYVTLSEALRASGLVPLHAAVAAGDSGTVAWLGASGIGKSTTLLHAVEAGWRAVAEDLCWLEPATLGVYGWDRGVRCWPETLERFFPLLRGAEPAPDGKRIIRYDRLGAASPRTGTLTRLALLERVSEGPSRWEAATARDLVKSLWEATGVPLSDRSREVTAAAVARLSRLPVTKLVLGNTPPPLGGSADGWSGQAGVG